MRTFLAAIVALVTLGLQFKMNLVPSGNGLERWAALIGGQCIGFGVLFLGYVWHAAWEEHHETLTSHKQDIDTLTRQHEQAILAEKTLCLERLKEQHERDDKQLKEEQENYRRASWELEAWRGSETQRGWYYRAKELEAKLEQSADDKPLDQANRDDLSKWRFQQDLIDHVRRLPPNIITPLSTMTVPTPTGRSELLRLLQQHINILRDYQNDVYNGRVK